MIKLAFGVATGVLLTALLSGCEESQPRGSSASAAAPVEKPDPAPVPAPVEPEPEPKRVERPKKKLEDCPSKGNPEFPSTEFEMAVRLKAQKPEGALTRADLGKVRSLNLAQVKLEELDVCLFSQMKNLRELFLGPGKIDDLSPIENLTKLESLRASLNPIADISPLQKMTKLDRLDLGQTQVRDLTPLASLTNLTELMLDNTPVEEIRALEKLEKLEVLSLKNTQVKDFSPLTQLKGLKTVYVAGTPGDIIALLPLRGRGVKVLDN